MTDNTTIDTQGSTHDVIQDDIIQLANELGIEMEQGTFPEHRFKMHGIVLEGEEAVRRVLLF
jgi:hypothetical protein